MNLEPNHSSYYDILELNQDATTDDIKRAYRKLLLLNHPDKSNGPTTIPVTLLKSAYNTLINNREDYDKALHTFKVRSGFVDIDGIDTYDLDDFTYNHKNQTFTLDCPRCTTPHGFSVTESNLELGIQQSTSNIHNLQLQCHSCSLWICLTYTAE